MNKVYFFIVLLLGSLPSFANDVKKAREAAENTTETIVLEKIETERLMEEKKRIESLTGTSAPKATVVPSPSLTRSAFPGNLWKFTHKSFVSLGVGSVQYPGVKNINSISAPAFFFSFGGYATDNLIIDFVLFQSQHFIEERGSNANLEGVFQPGAGLNIKYSPLEGRVKPYIGVAGLYKMSRWFKVDKKGGYIKDVTDNIALKRWYQAFDVGLLSGADVALGNRVGVNLDFRYQLNFYTEVNSATGNVFVKQPLDERNSLALSLNLKFYFN